MLIWAEFPASANGMKTNDRSKTTSRAGVRLNEEPLNDASPIPMLAAKDATMFSFGILKRVLLENSSAEITTPSPGGSETSISDGYADSDSEDPIDEAWTA
jgi:hypothetical protein